MWTQLWEKTNQTKPNLTSWLYLVTFQKVVLRDVYHHIASFKIPETFTLLDAGNGFLRCGLSGGESRSSLPRWSPCSHLRPGNWGFVGSSLLRSLSLGNGAVGTGVGSSPCSECTGASHKPGAGPSMSPHLPGPTSDTLHMGGCI